MIDRRVPLERIVEACNSVERGSSFIRLET